ncbi:hypothetical protein NUW54_g11966 [Trametes sanguinea]|uniref:Uncharacterized protein n=1 Tax=Trametes sanguinea TaxID=158606 RepID=A0ACC1N5U2_9APHY|nr:hypothetical protein NUW54_g11966 [Trametes sanguinea]
MCTSLHAMPETRRPTHILIDHLREVIRPLSQANEFISVFDLGPEVEVYFRALRVSPDMQLAILRAYIWTEDKDDFVVAAGRAPLELSLVDAEHIWGLLTAWSASQ